MRGFGLAIIFGIIIGTSSSIFIASPLLLFLGEKRLRPAAARVGEPGKAAARLNRTSNQNRSCCSG